jgi:putative PIN family toxin of toxin-antitoxin system
LRIFADPSVLVSAFATRGLCADLLRHIVLEHELLVGEVVLSELRKALREKVRLLSQQIEAIASLLRENAVVPGPRTHLGLGLEDRDDEWIVASAVSGRADVLVTGDSDLLALRNPPLGIVNPRGLWELLRITDERSDAQLEAARGPRSVLQRKCPVL